MRIFGSFSMGRSSAMMCHILQNDPEYTGTEKLYLMANTGMEDDRSLDFAHKVDKLLGLNLVWLEAVTHPDERKGCTHKVVTYETATRIKDARKEVHPFQAMIAKYGIPNVAFPHCTRELKTNAMISYARSIGWGPGTYRTALGIRSDEPDRFDKKAEERRFFYPLAERGIEKPDVIDFWETQPFDLGIDEEEGNCVACFKKTDLKLVRNIKRHPEPFHFTGSMEARYGGLWKHREGKERVFFRKNRSTADMMLLAASFDGLPDARLLNRKDKDAGCAESCEAFPPETESADAALLEGK